MQSNTPLAKEGAAPVVSASRNGMSENRQAKGVASRKPMSSGENPTRTVIADAHPVFRYGLRRLLESASGFRVIGEASDGAELVKLARQLKPDLVVVDLALPGRSGLEVLCDLVACRPSASSC